MKYPKIVKEETTYYSLIIYDRAGKISEEYYKTFNGALQALKEKYTWNRIYNKAQIRKETVWFRDPENEYSSSAPCAFFEDGKMNIANIMEC